MMMEAAVVDSVASGISRGQGQGQGHRAGRVAPCPEAGHRAEHGSTRQVTSWHTSTLGR